MQWATNQKMAVVLDGYAEAGPCPHGNSTNDLTHFFSIHETWDNFVGYWATFAKRYKNYSNLIYQLLHEPLNCNSDVYTLHMQEAIDAIRKEAPDAVCVLQPVNCQSDFKQGEWFNGGFYFQQTNPINRSNIAFSFDPYGFWRYPDNSKAAIKSIFDDMQATWLIEHGYCVFLCEFGADMGSHQTYSNWDTVFNKNIMEYCDENGYSGMHAYEWNTGRDDGVLSNWNGTLNAFGVDIAAYYKANADPLIIIDDDIGCEESMADITFSGTTKDKTLNTPLNGVLATITITKPGGSKETVTATTTNGAFTTKKTYLAGIYSATCVYTLDGYNTPAAITRAFTVAKVNGDMTVTFDVSVA